MALKPIGAMAAASAACCVTVLALAGAEDLAAVLLGVPGPLAAAIATWLVVERTHATAPSRLIGVMITLFAVKMVLFGGYVAVAVIVLPAGTAALIASFTSQYITLHVLEALYLRRLLTGGGEPLGVS